MSWEYVTLPGELEVVEERSVYLVRVVQGERLQVEVTLENVPKGPVRNLEMA